MNDDPWEDWEHLLDSPDPEPDPIPVPTGKEDPCNWCGVPGRMVSMIELYPLVPPKGYFEWLVIHKPVEFCEVYRFWGRPKL